MNRVYYQEQALEGIARKAIERYDPQICCSKGTAIPIENIIEAHGLSLEYQYLRNDGRILGETIFTDGLTAVYNKDTQSYQLIPVQAGTILIDASLCQDHANVGRLRFTCAHELSHWLLHRQFYEQRGTHAAMLSSSQDDQHEIQANLLGAILLMPMPLVKRCFYDLRPRHSDEQLICKMATVFQVSKQAMRIRLESHKLL